mmetsp:Transcript_33969/g.95612  ORF Transcript_33969/g.95612 Transcript_33969/m.95612 type:complete len:230 (-) Transcript_33969:1815-2504(-)
MTHSAAKVCGNVTAETTLPDCKFRTVIATSAEIVGLALYTLAVRVVTLGHGVGRAALSVPSVKGGLTQLAPVKGENVAAVLDRFLVPFATFVRHRRVLVQLFQLHLHFNQLLHVLTKICVPLHQSGEFGQWVGKVLAAERALRWRKIDQVALKAPPELFLDAILVERMPAREEDRGLCLQVLAPADVAKVPTNGLQLRGVVRRRRRGPLPATRILRYQVQYTVHFTILL